MEKLRISGELERLKIITSIFSRRGESKKKYKNDPSLKVSVKDFDDCAVYDFDNISLVIGSDFVRGTGFNMFRMGYLNHYDVGYYLAIANLSDIAAMGAKPIGLTSIVRYTKDLTDKQFKEIINGINDATSKYDCAVIGGDIGGYDENVLAATAFGITPRGKYLLRSNVREKDILCVTGYIGLPETALAYFRNAKPQGLKLTKSEEQVLINSWKRPQARIKEGLILSESGIGHACQDISDGLKQTIMQMSLVSKKQFLVKEELLPIHNVTKKVAMFLNTHPSHLAMSNSVDFQLLFTISPKDEKKCRSLFEKAGTYFYTIGEQTNRKDNKMLTTENKLIDLPGFVWNQNFKDVTSQIIEKAKR